MLKTFKSGGIYPTENKITAESKIRHLPAPGQVSIPIQQHIGTPPRILVERGDFVKAGQLIAKGEGFISASIHMPGGMRGRGRAEVLLNHLTRLKSKFGTKAANNIGIMGHSRGGEGVVKAARIAQQTSSPHTINA